jgi:hypothetical protein
MAALAMCKVNPSGGRHDGSPARGQRPSVRLHDASRRNDCLAYCNFAAGDDDNIYLKSRVIINGMLYAEDDAENPSRNKRSASMGDAACLFLLIVFFILCALYVAALDRM